MSLPCIQSLNKQIDEFIKKTNISKDEEAMLKLLSSLLDFFYLSVRKLYGKPRINEKFNNIDEEIYSVKNELITYLEGLGYYSNDFSILKFNDFDDNSAFISSLIKNFLEYFGNYALEKNDQHMYIYMFHLIYYILLAIVKDLDPKAFDYKFIKFYMFHIVHFFKKEKEAPESYYIFYEGAFNYLNKILESDNFYFQYLFEMNKNFSKSANNNENITEALQKEKENMCSYPKQENLDFLSKFTPIYKAIKQEIEKVDEEEELNKNNNGNNNINVRDALTNGLLNSFVFVNKKINIAETILKEKVGDDFVCKELEKFKNNISELTKKIEKYHLTNVHFSLMVGNYYGIQDQKFSLDFYISLLEKFEKDNKIIEQNLENTFKDIIESKSFKDLYFIAMHSSYVESFVRENNLVKQYKIFMDKYAENIDKLIIYAPLTIGIKAYFANYFRIALNIHSVTLMGDLKICSERDMYTSYLLINLLHESFHFIIRINKEGQLSKDCLSPESKKIFKTYSEIGVDLIKHIFGTEYILFISENNCKLLNNKESWNNKNTNFKVFDELYLEDKVIVNKNGNKNLGTGLKCNVTKNEGNRNKNEENFKFCGSSSIRWCY